MPKTTHAENNHFIVKCIKSKLKCTVVKVNVLREFLNHEISSCRIDTAQAFR